MTGSVRRLTNARTGQDGSLADFVYERILQRIIAGDFPLHSKLPPEVALSKEMGVSRPILREALRQLREDEIVSSRQGSGSYVQRQPDKAVLTFAPVGSIADIQRNFEFRAVVESEAAAFAALRWDTQTLGDIHNAYQALEGCIEGGQLGDEEDARFHLAICRAADNSYFFDTLSSMKSQTLTAINLARNLSLTKPKKRLRAVQSEHRELLSAIEGRQPDQARQAMRSHIENARERVFQGDHATMSLVRGAASRIEPSRDP